MQKPLFMVTVFLAGAWAADGQNRTTETQTLHFPSKVVAQGQSRQRLARAYERLCSPPLDSSEFVLSDLHFHLKRRFTEYSGDISGRMLGALSEAQGLLDKDTPLLATLVQEIPQYQKADGHFGAEQDLAHEVNQKRDMPILWGNGRMLLALAQHCRRQGDSKLLATARSLGDYIISTRPYFGKEENFTRVGGVYASGFTTCYPSLIDGLVALGQVSGESKYYDEARFIGRLSLLDRSFEQHHSHGRLSAYRGMLDLDRLTGKKEFTDSVVQGCRTIADDLMLPTGGVTEVFDRAGHYDEGCSEADWIRVNLLLWQATGQNGYLDTAEMTLRNHLLPTQFGNGGFGHHVFRSLHDGRHVYPGGGIGNEASEAYWCCSMHATQLLAELVRWGVLRREDAVCVTWLSEVIADVPLNETADVSAGQGAATVSTRQVDQFTWTVAVSSEQAGSFKLRLRVPGWAKSIMIDGRKCVARDGWTELAWRGGRGRTWQVKFDDTLRLAGPYGQQQKSGEPVRIFAGPDLYCLPDAWIAQGLLDADAVPAVLLPEDAAGAQAIAAVVKADDGTWQQARLVPMSQRPLGACRYLFHVGRMPRAAFDDRAAKAKPMPQPGKPLVLRSASEGAWTTYFSGKEVASFENRWHESPEVVAYAQPGRAVLAIKARTAGRSAGLIGTAQCGDVLYGTDAASWQVTPCPPDMPSEWLTDPDATLPDADRPVELGSVGIAPWCYIPGHFTGTPARWIWAQQTAPAGGDTDWLFRLVFDVPQ